MNENTKICPILSLSKMAVECKGTKNNLVLCQKEDCGWFTGEECAILNIPYQLWRKS